MRSQISTLLLPALLLLVACSGDSDKGGDGADPKDSAAPDTADTGDTGTPTTVTKVAVPASFKKSRRLI